jgi:hypothetical protein
MNFDNIYVPELYLLDFINLLMNLISRILLKIKYNNQDLSDF